MPFSIDAYISIAKEANVRLMDIQNLEYQVRIEQMENRLEYLEVLNSRSDAQKENIGSRTAGIMTNELSYDTRLDASMQTDHMSGDLLNSNNEDVILFDNNIEKQQSAYTSGISVVVETQRKVGLRLASDTEVAFEQHQEIHPPNRGDSRLCKDEDDNEKILHPSLSDVEDPLEENIPQGESAAERIAVARAMKAESLVVELTAELLKYKEQARLFVCAELSKVDKSVSVNFNDADRSEHDAAIKELKDSIHQKEELIREAQTSKEALDETMKKLEVSLATSQVCCMC